MKQIFFVSLFLFVYLPVNIYSCNNCEGSNTFGSSSQIREVSTYGGLTTSVSSRNPNLLGLSINPSSISSLGSAGSSYSYSALSSSSNSLPSSSTTFYSSSSSSYPSSSTSLISGIPSSPNSIIYQITSTST